MPSNDIPRSDSVADTSYLSIVVVLLLLPLCLWGQSCFAQPKAIGPEDISRIRQLTEFSGDWYGTDAFDLDQYLTVRVTIARIDIPDGAGNAFLWFTTPNPEKFEPNSQLPSDIRFKATLQSADAVRKLGMRAADLPPGTEAILRGWAATNYNVTGSVMLIDDIQVVANGRIFALHANNPKMASKRQQTETTQ